MTWKQNIMWWKQPSLITGKKMDRVNKTYKPQASKSKKYKSISNETNKGMKLDKSRSLDKSSASQRTEA